MNENNKQFTLINKEIVYRGFFKLERYHVKHTLYAGGWSAVLQRELFRRGSCVAVLLYDPDRDELVLIEQFRVGAVLQPKRAWLWEIVAGAIEEGETAEQVAYRESIEEAGCDIKELRVINEFYTTPGGASERITLFYGRVDSAGVGGVHGLPAEHEDILVRAVTFEQAWQMLQAGGIESAIPIIALQWLALQREQLRREWCSDQ